MEWLRKINEWGPVFFGVLIFGPMWAAAMDATGLQALAGISNLTLMMAIGGSWGLVAKLRGRWL